MHGAACIWHAGFDTKIRPLFRIWKINNVSAQLAEQHLDRHPLAQFDAEFPFERADLQPVAHHLAEGRWPQNPTCLAPVKVRPDCVGHAKEKRVAGQLMSGAWRQAT